MRQRRHIYYLPGYISLVLFPLFCMLFLWHRGVFKEYRTIRMFWVKEESYGKHFLAARPARHFREIYLTGNDEADSKTYSEIESDLKNLTANCDTLHGMRIQLGPNTRYRALVRVLDILPDHRNYHTSENGIWVWYEMPDTTPMLQFTNICGTAEVAAEMRLKNLQKQAQAEQASRIADIIKFLWPCAVLWILLVALALRARLTP
jgi:hypothetical protein